MSDYHLHLIPHDEPAGEYRLAERIEQSVEHAGTLGLAQLGFTEHWYRCLESAPILGEFWEREERRDLADQARQTVRLDRTMSLEAYVGAVIDAKDAGLPVKLGLEVDFFPESFEAVIAFLADYPWDFLIGSIHWIDGWGVDDSRVAFEFERRGIDVAWEQYFELELELASSGAVDVLAHVDVVKKQGRRPEREPIEWYDRIAEAARASGTAVEVSSQGLRKACREEYPSPEFLRSFRRSGVPITLASDGHHPHEVGWGHDQVVKAARNAGYTDYLLFTGRQGEPTALPETFQAVS